MDGLTDNLQCVEQTYGGATAGGSHLHHHLLTPAPPASHSHHMTLGDYTTSPPPSSSQRTSQALTAASHTLAGLHGLHSDVSALQQSSTAASAIAHSRTSDVTNTAQRLHNDVTNAHTSAGRIKHEQLSPLDTSVEQKGRYTLDMTQRYLVI